MVSQDYENQIKTQLKKASNESKLYKVDSEADKKVYQLIETVLNKTETQTQQVNRPKEVSVKRSAYLWPAIAASFLLVSSFIFINFHTRDDRGALPVAQETAGLQELVSMSQNLEVHLSSSMTSSNSPTLMTLNTEIEAIDKVLLALYQKESSDELKKQYWNKRIQTLESIQLLVSLSNQTQQRI